MNARTRAYLLTLLCILLASIQSSLAEDRVAIIYRQSRTARKRA
jgi:hypothetical protein